MKAMTTPGTHLIGLSLVIAACSGMIGGPQTGGESHFLRACESTCGQGLDCVSGLCTRTCLLGSSSCGDLASKAVCTDESIEPGAVVVCDVACEQDGDCSALGSTHRCREGFCRGSAVSSDAESDAGSSSDATTSSVEGSCRRLHQIFADGTTGIRDPAGCGTCSCENGSLSCTEEGCGIGVPVFPCPAPFVSDPVDVLSHTLSGDQLMLELGHGGGCDEHDFALCYDESFDESYPVQGALRVIHDAHEDTCEAYLNTTLYADLSAYADYYNEIYRSEGGLISTAYGLYAFGALGCDERELAANQQTDDLIAQLDLSCQDDSECQWISVDTTCTARCGTLVRTATADSLATALGTISTSVCGDFEASGCGPVIYPPCPAPNAVACVNGQCATVDG